MRSEGRPPRATALQIEASVHRALTDQQGEMQAPEDLYRSLGLRRAQQLAGPVSPGSSARRGAAHQRHQAPFGGFVLAASRAHHEWNTRDARVQSLTRLSSRTPRVTPRRSMNSELRWASAA